MLCEIKLYAENMKKLDMIDLLLKLCVIKLCVKELCARKLNMKKIVDERIIYKKEIGEIIMCKMLGDIYIFI
jgi:hypothetical protein